VGPDEVKSGRFTMKDLVSKEQSSAAPEELATLFAVQSAS
jgi:hypothetical protein